MSVWDDPDLRGGGDFVKLEQVGDTIEGTIIAVRTHQFDDGSKVPQLLIARPDGVEVTWSAGQIQAKRKLAELRPEAGDYLKVTYEHEERRSGGKTLKHLDVEVRRGNGKPATAPPKAGTGGAGSEPPPAVDPAAWAALDKTAQDAILARMGMVAAGQAEPPPF